MRRLRHKWMTSTSLPALTPIIVFGFLLMQSERTGEVICMSLPVRPDRVLPFTILLPVITWLAIFIFSFGWVPAKSTAAFLQKVMKKPTQVSKVANAIRLLISALATTVMLVAVLGK